MPLRPKLLRYVAWQQRLLSLPLPNPGAHPDLQGFAGRLRFKSSCDILNRSLSYTWPRLQRLRNASDIAPPLALWFSACLPQASQVPFYVLRFPGYVLASICSHRKSLGSARSFTSVLLGVSPHLRKNEPGFSPASRLASLLALRFCFKPETHLGFPAFHLPSLPLLRRVPSAPLGCLLSIRRCLSSWSALP